MTKRIKSKALFLLLGLLISACNSNESTGDQYALSCFDGVRNGSETGVDCGGDCPEVCIVYENGLEGVILDRLHLREDRTYTLTGPLLIRDQSTLEISAGTNIKVLPGVGAYIAVAQGGKLYCYGNDEVPITIESAAENPAPGDWGGIIALGKAYVNSDGTHLSDLGNYLYAGPYPNDISVYLRNTKIKHTGAKIDGVTTAGLSLYSNGVWSELNKVEISESNGPGIKIVGGSLNLNKLYIHDVANGIEMSEGWQGSISELYMSTIANNAFILKNLEVNPSANPYTKFTGSNMSVIGPMSGSVFDFSSGGAEFKLTNAYLKGVNQLFRVEGSEAESLFPDKVTIDQIELQNSANEFSMIYPLSIAQDFIVESEATGAENKDQLPSWITSWIYN